MTEPLLERAAEVSALHQSLERLAEGHGGIVLVEAPAGLGKTTLLRVARSRTPALGLGVLTARGAELERDFTFGVVRQLFESVLPKDVAAREKLFTGAARPTERLFATADSDSSPDDLPSSLFPLLNGLYWLLAGLSEIAPLVLVVDDAQWADLPSLRFLGFLARRLDSVAVTMIIASRTGPHDDEGLLDDILAAGDVTLLEPKELSTAAVAGLVRQALGQDAADEFCAACHAVTAGNPLFVRELLRALAANGIRPDAAAAATVKSTGPDALRRHVIARLRREPSGIQQVARAVAVLGDDTDLALVARQSGLTPLAAAAAAERLTRHGIFDHDDPPAFVHAVVRDVVLSLIPLAERSAEHERAAAVLREAGEPVARVASHLLRTTPDANPDRVNVLLAAATQARKRGSPSGATAYLLRARNEPPPPPMRSEVSRLLGICEARQYALVDAETHLREAWETAGSPAQRALCAYSLARFRNVCGAPKEAAILLTQALAELPPGQNAELAAELEGELIGIARNDLGGRTRLLEQLASFQSRPSAVADAHQAAETVFSGGPADAAVTLALRALNSDLLTPNRAAIWSAVHVLIVADRLDEAEQHLNLTMAASVQNGLLFPVPMIRAYLARIAFLRGDLAQAREHVDLGVAGSHGPKAALPALNATDVDLLIEDAQLAKAEAVVQNSVLSGNAEPRTALHLWLLGARTRLRAAQGNVNAALADAMLCGRLYQQWGAVRLLDVPWRLSAADAVQRLGERDRAVEILTEELRLARAFGVPRRIATALRGAAALAGTSHAARELLQEAVDLLKRSPARLELARTLAQLGAIHTECGDHQAGSQAIRQAAGLASDCQARGLVDRLALCDARPRSGVHAFTPAEGQVAHLAATGLTNRRIAERLFLSEKTVEAHLSRAYRKLGVRSRTELAVHMTTVAKT
ncbi:DNA-binding NarL/FixJ family response regulator [Kibdelosporangium banguiense]|uniref:DNA-binding NarL/FixJ family response regulator n=1 Tax=Kibdelosporangium banguiense TaxID=1365924 RepID=A0ABS4TL00_9PSEU|nr:LuxR family transcriptional regulator [Kibdelosporangium banguiense]MBP2325093.1 DNA-binding NarL/FixJ family response regulator [Kibdelosporangium banguiense]